MRQIINFVVFLILGSGIAYSQNIPAPDIANAGGQIANAGNQAAAQAAQTQLIRQQTELLKQQTEALKQQNALLMQQTTLVPKPKITDINPATGLPKFATYTEYEDAKDEWLIEEAVRRFEALHPTKKK